ncbi:MAG: GNAT family N-acetyltransferase [Acidipila sp.]|nr:GNAT family N-acetyltransferase [Acidipila sp.]
MVIAIRQLDAAEGRQYLGALADVLLDCVAGGASVSFMASLSKAEAETFFAGVLEGVRKGERILLAAFIESKLLGTVQVLLATPPNQAHRADVAKLLVAREARGQGVGSRLMERAEQASREAGRSLLVLDTVTGDQAEKLYLRMGWSKTGVIPKYAVYPDGRWCDTSVMWKWIE